MSKKESPSVRQDVFTQHLWTHPTVVGKIKNAVMLLWNILLHIYCFYEPLFSGITKIYKISIVFPGWNLAQKSYKSGPSPQSDLCSLLRKFPQLLVGKARTRNVSAKKKTLVVGPSDRIGANYSPSARHLLLKTIRKKRKKSTSRMPHIER